MSAEIRKAIEFARRMAAKYPQEGYRVDFFDTALDALAAREEELERRCSDFKLAIEKARTERDEAKQQWWDQRNDWVAATGKNQATIDALAARVEQLEQALAAAKGFVEAAIEQGPTGTVRIHAAKTWDDIAALLADGRTA